MQAIAKILPITYSLDVPGIGLNGMSSLISNPPEIGNPGFFTVIIDPASNPGSVIPQVLTLLLDTSASMEGNKLAQMKNAATYIINHLNANDRYNIIAFNEQPSMLWTQHRIKSGTNNAEAIAFVTALQANGQNRNMYSAFETAITQYDSVHDSTANTIILVSDGQAEAGLAHTPLFHGIANLLDSNQAHLTVHTVGIGNAVDADFLASLSDYTHGYRKFVSATALQTELTGLYLQIQNPVLTNVQYAIEPSNAVFDVFPAQLSNLYQSSQLMICGRYDAAVPVDIVVQGSAFGQIKSNIQHLNLSDSLCGRWQCLNRIWAAQKIADLLTRYYIAGIGSTEALEIKNQVIAMGCQYGIQTDFPELAPVAIAEQNPDINISAMPVISLLGNYPNPFNPETKISFVYNNNTSAKAVVRIYNIRGQLIRELPIKITHKGTQNITWNSLNLHHKPVGSGVYLYTVQCDNTILSRKMLLLK
jgi:Ca-activated chloride channel family protein